MTFPAVHTILHAKPLGVEIQCQWKLPDPFVCQLLVRGMNDVYLVRAAGKQYAARVWRAAYAGRNGTDYELRFLDFIANRGIPVPTGVKLPDRDAYHITIEGPDGLRDVALFNWARGDLLHFHPDPVPYARRTGELFAKMHLASLDFLHPQPRYTDYAGNIRAHFPAIAELAVDRPEDMAFWTMAKDRLLAAYDKLERNSLPWGVSHGDIHAHNVMVADDDITILDFDSCGEDFMAQELVSLVWAGRKNGFPEAAIQAFLDGYDSVRPRTPEELRLTPLFYAMKEMRYFTGFADAVNAIGHNTFRYPGLDWFRASVEKNCSAAGVI